MIDWPERHPDDDPRAGDDAPPAPPIPCASCHRLVPLHHVVPIGGRPLCFGCASAWFGDGDE